jgi:hypothetical protein
VLIRGFERCQRDAGDWNHEFDEFTRIVAKGVLMEIGIEESRIV